MQWPSAVNLAQQAPLNKGWSEAEAVWTSDVKRWPALAGQTRRLRRGRTLVSRGT
jgi:hypothetical protein